MTELGLPAWSVDPIKMALSKAVPAYPLDVEGGSEAVCREMWPFIHALIGNLIETGVDVVIEGEILPEHVVELRRTHRVSACFLGYATIDPVEKAKQIRGNEGYPNDWTAGLTFDQLVELASHSVAFSRFIRDECQRLNLLYVDVSDGFMASLDTAFHAMVSQYSSIR